MNQYQVGGSLAQDYPYYVVRPADDDLYQALRRGEFCYVFNARQMGKSSLMVRVLHRLEQDGVWCGAIDLSRIGTETLKPEQWYKGFAVELWQALGLFQRMNLKRWWDEHLDLPPVQRLGLLLEEILAMEVADSGESQPDLVLFLDEVDSVRGLDFSLNDFFGLIRACHNRRSVKPAYRRLTFAFLGVTTPSDLMTDLQRTPFNVGRAIDLGGFLAADAQPLVRGLVGCVRDPRRALQSILMWTGGQPFLVQKLCRLLVEYPPEAPSLSDNEHIHHLVQKFIVQDWEFHDEPEHLRTIRDRLLNASSLTGRLLGLYQQILLQGSVAFDGSREHIELLLSGLVSNQQRYLVVKNPIYQAVFDLAWVRHHLRQLRPYAPALEAWLAASPRNESFLLRGQTLQEALTWALGKSLSDEDYQFLGASQELAKREVQTTLETFEQASRILATARQRASQEVRNRRIGGLWLLAGMLGATLPVLLVRTLGLLQGAELGMFDQFVRWRPPEPGDRRVVVVAIDEQDITQVGHPMSDRVLAQTLRSIQAQNPRAIGLDIYRDLPVAPGQAELAQVFRSTPNLIGIEKVVGRRVAPPPILSQAEQVGFVDQIEDTDGKVRRSLLSVIVGDTLHYSLAAKLALSYLEKEGVTLEPLDQSGQRLRLGKAIFEPFLQNDGGYIRAAAGGYQLLINFRGTEAAFLNIALREVLAGKVPAETFRDRVVIVGYVAESVNDYFRTPYNGGWFGASKPINGVTLHANIVSQILGAALDARPLIRVWPELGEWLWVLLWSGMGAIAAWGLRSPLKLTAAMLLALITLVSSSYLAFLTGWWIPMVPAFLSLLGAAIALLIATAKQSDRLRFQRTFALLVETQKNYPEAGRIAIEYLRQSETRENQSIIDLHLR
ncbi:CHASE2 domain-containing protein [Geitlerinema sp. PCC 7407]|uniref:CHASE2 domain-containing protein n=1 Tax=Geitlerinema sp. PCC 7407 TaxID=1173025 RepID=UPI00029FBE42|nr:CHASE2 domain-containing protein [Geitlerinema sp. PCC 7407]AFY66183.1 putative Chase2 sensor protein [Geitlerinema sp. PCC 7407]